MLHMVVNTHNPESCAFRNEENAKVVTAALDAFAKAAADVGATIEGFWANRSAHTFFILVEAPSAHAIDEAMVVAGLIGRTSTDIFPVMTMDEVKSALHVE